MSLPLFRFRDAWGPGRRTTGQRRRMGESIEIRVTKIHENGRSLKLEREPGLIRLFVIVPHKR